MVYLYLCLHCKLKTEITKPMAEVDRVEHCHVCESELQRVWQAPMVKTSDGLHCLMLSLLYRWLPERVYALAWFPRLMTVSDVNVDWLIRCSSANIRDRYGDRPSQ